jgi:hypothetical protein
MKVKYTYLDNFEKEHTNIIEIDSIDKLNALKNENGYLEYEFLEDDNNEEYDKLVREKIKTISKEERDKLVKEFTETDCENLDFETMYEVCYNLREKEYLENEELFFETYQYKLEMEE